MLPCWRTQIHTHRRPEGNGRALLHKHLSNNYRGQEPAVHAPDGGQKSGLKKKKQDLCITAKHHSARLSLSTKEKSANFTVKIPI